MSVLNLFANKAQEAGGRRAIANKFNTDMALSLPEAIIKGTTT